VTHSVLGLEHRHDLPMFGQTAGVNQFDPITDRFAVFGFDVADLCRDAPFHAGHGHCLSAGWVISDTASL
jgi:hypothetical protein